MLAAVGEPREVVGRSNILPIAGGLWFIMRGFGHFIAIWTEIRWFIFVKVELQNLG